MRQKIGVFTANVAAGVATLINPSIDLPRTHYLTSLFFQVALTYTNTNGGGTIVEDGLARFFNFRLFLEGDDPVLRLRGDDLKCYLINHYSQTQDYTEADTTKGAGRTASWNFELPIADRKLRNDPRLTKVDLALSDNPRLEMDFGTGAMIESTGDLVITAVTVTVFVEVDIRPAGLPGPDVLGRYLPLRRIRSVANPNLVASTASQQARLPFGRLVREYHIIARTLTTPARSNSLISTLEFQPNMVRAGAKTWQDLLSETRAGLSITPLVGAVVEDFDKSKQLIGANMLNLIGTRDMLAEVATNALASGLVLTFIEESIDFPTLANFNRVKKYLRR